MVSEWTTIEVLEAMGVDPVWAADVTHPHDEEIEGLDALIRKWLLKGYRMTHLERKGCEGPPVKSWVHTQGSTTIWHTDQLRPPPKFLKHRVRKMRKLIAEKALEMNNRRISLEAAQLVSGEMSGTFLYRSHQMAVEWAMTLGLPIVLARIGNYSTVGSGLSIELPDE